MDGLTLLQNRATPARLATPAPSAEELDRILAAAVRAPDHGRLRPWRFIVVAGEARERLGDLMVRRLKETQPEIPEAVADREREKPLRAPLIVVVAAKVQPGKIPVIEQQIAAGAAAQNIQLAAHALGYGVMWKTGWPAYDSGIKAAFGLGEEDSIIAFLYVGTIAMPAKNNAAEAAPYVSHW